MSDFLLEQTVNKYQILRGTKVKLHTTLSMKLYWLYKTIILLTDANC